MDSASPAGMSPLVTGRLMPKCRDRPRGKPPRRPPGWPRAPREPRRGDKAGQPAVAEPADPPQPARRAAASQMSSGFSGSGPMLAASTLKYLPWKDTVCCRRAAGAQGFVEHGAAPPGRDRERARSALRAGCSPKTGRTRAGARPASDASCLATRTGWRLAAPTPGAHLQPAVRARAYAIPSTVPPAARTPSRTATASRCRVPPGG
jgi:hypothetical protein